MSPKNLLRDIDSNKQKKDIYDNLVDVYNGDNRVQKGPI